MRQQSLDSSLNQTSSLDNARGVSDVRNSFDQPDGALMYFRWIRDDDDLNDDVIKYRLDGKLCTAAPTVQASNFWQDLKTDLRHLEKLATTLTLQLDCSGITEVCSSGLAWFFQVHDDLMRVQMKFRLTNVPESMLEIIRLLELDEFFAETLVITN